MTSIKIEPEDIETVLAEIEGLAPPSLVNSYMCNASYDLPTLAERDAALTAMRDAWIAASGRAPRAAFRRAAGVLHPRRHEHDRRAAGDADAAAAPVGRRRLRQPRRRISAL